MLNVLHIMTRLEVAPDAKLVEKLAKGVNSSLNQLTYPQIASFLESLLNLDYKPSPEFSLAIIKELECR